jgi:hypothetical protein
MNKSGQWVHMLEAEERSRLKRDRILLTSYLLKKKCNDINKLATLWGVGTPTIKKYIKEAKSIAIDLSTEERINKIKKEKQCNYYNAVGHYYESNLWHNKLGNPAKEIGITMGIIFLILIIIIIAIGISTN